MKNINVDIKMLRAHISFIFGSLSTPVLWTFIKENGGGAFTKLGTVDELQDTFNKAQNKGYGIHFCPNTFKLEADGSIKKSPENVVAVNALWVDWDKKDNKLYTPIARAASCQTKGRGGFHKFWLVERSQRKNPALIQAVKDGLMYSLAMSTNSDPAPTNIHSNIRVAGSYNLKDTNNPVKVMFQHNSVSYQYTLAEFESAITKHEKRSASADNVINFKGETDYIYEKAKDVPLDAIAKTLKRFYDDNTRPYLVAICIMRSFGVSPGIGKILLKRWLIESGRKIKKELEEGDPDKYSNEVISKAIRDAIECSNAKIGASTDKYLDFIKNSKNGRAA
jgi:hypothetical protein